MDVRYRGIGFLGASFLVAPQGLTCALQRGADSGSKWDAEELRGLYFVSNTLAQLVAGKKIDSIAGLRLQSVASNFARTSQNAILPEMAYPALRDLAREAGELDMDDFFPLALCVERELARQQIYFLTTHEIRSLQIRFGATLCLEESRAQKEFQQLLQGWMLRALDESEKHFWPWPYMCGELLIAAEGRVTYAPEGLGEAAKREPQKALLLLKRLYRDASRNEEARASMCLRYAAMDMGAFLGEHPQLRNYIQYFLEETIPYGYAWGEMIDTGPQILPFVPPMQRHYAAPA